MKTIVEKDGEDLVIILPQEVLNELGVKISEYVDISEEDGKIVIARKEQPAPDRYRSPSGSWRPVKR